MQLFDLAPELLAGIFDAIARSRRINRLMRLRLVSRRFKFFIDNAISRLHLLSDFPDGAYCHARAFFLDYLAYQAWVARDSKSPLSRIWRAAADFSERAGNASHDAIIATIKALGGLPRGYVYETCCRRGLPPGQEPSRRELEADACVAAIYLGDRLYVEHLIRQGWQFCAWGVHGQDVVSDLFGPAFVAAAVKGDVSMLRLLISSNPNHSHFDPLPFPLRACILENAARYGHEDAFNFALDSGPLDLDKGTDIDRHVYPEYSCLCDAVKSTRIVNNYCRGIDMFVSSNRALRNLGSLEKLLAQKAREGHVDVVKHLLSLGASPNGRMRRNMASDGQLRTDGPLLDSVIGRSPDAAKLLLQHGANPNGFSDLHTPLMSAAWSSTLSIAELLLAAGANPNDGCPPPIVLAIAKEDTAMFRVLREHGARLDTPETGAWAMAVARFWGYDSMVELLVNEGVESDVVLRRCPERRELSQISWHLFHRGEMAFTDSLWALEWT
ncbi:ankyrin repeat-containing domain protein [Xylaria grammica]|nr:ankyrin repeat-containing domain protein [Xylaria grammica]